MASLGTLAVNIVARTDKFTKGITKSLSSTERFRKGLGKLTGGLGSFTTALAGAASAGGIGLMIKRQLDAADAIGKTSDRLGIATEKLIAFHHASELNGVSTKTFDMALQRMTRRVAEAAKGTGEARDALKELGLSATGLQKLSLDQRFTAVAEAMRKVETQSDRVRLSMKLFDSEGVALVNVLRLGADGLAKMESETVKLGLSLDRGTIAKAEEANDAITRMNASFSGLARTAAVELAPAIVKVTDSIRGLVSIVGPGLDKFYKSVIGGQIEWLERLQSVANIFLKIEGVLDRFKAKHGDGFVGRMIGLGGASGETRAGLIKYFESIDATLDGMIAKKKELLGGKKGGGGSGGAAATPGTSNDATGGYLGSALNGLAKLGKMAGTVDETLTKVNRRGLLYALAGRDPSGRLIKPKSKPVAGGMFGIMSQVVGGLLAGSGVARKAGAAASNLFSRTLSGQSGTLSLAESGTAESYRQRAAIRRQGKGEKDIKKVADNTKAMRDGIDAMVGFFKQGTALLPANLGGGNG